MEAQNTEKRHSEKQKKSKTGRAVAIAVIILLLLALIVCLIIIFTHRHTMTHYAYAEATCTAGGNAEYWYCAGCDGYFEDEEGENEVEFSDLILPAAGHEWTAASCDSPRRCNICGYSDGAALGHSWGDYEFSPSDCGSEGAILRVCTACGEVERIAVPVHGNAHNWGSIAVVQPSCVSAGRAVLTCADCGETVSSVIPATGAHHWDDGKITMPGCTGTGSIIHTCIDCGATETDVIPASGHVWISATCTSARECATCGAVSGSALGHSWGEYVIYEDIHLRECGHSGCNAVEYAEHTYDDQSLCVCGAQRGTEINIITSIRSWYPGAGPYYTQSIYNSGISSGDIQIPVSAIQGVNSFLAQSFSEVDFMIKSEALDNDVQLNLSVFGEHEEDGSPVDFYATFINGDVSIEYHPMRYFIAFYDLELDAFVPVKFCEGCDRCSDHDHSDDPLSLYDPAYSYTDAFKCNACENCYTRTIDELYEILRSEDSPLNIQFAAGEDIDLTFRIGWNWAYCINEPGYPIESNPEVFEIRSEQGNKYYFTNGYWVTEPTNVDNMDTLFGVEDPVTEGNNTEYFDTMGQKWSASFEEGDFQRDVIDVLYNISFSPIK